MIVKASSIADDWEKAEDSLFELMPQIPAISDKYTKTLEIQLGIAALYYQYGAPLESNTKSTGELAEENKQQFLAQCKKVLAIDPNNKPVLTLLSMRACRDFTNTRNMAINQLERLIDSARKRKSNEIVIFQNSLLGKYFSEEDNCVIGKLPYNGSSDYGLLINDFDLANKLLHEEMDKNFPDVLAQINNAQKKDSDNAYYNYLKAHLFLEFGEKELALKEVEEGVSKRYFSSFQEELAMSIKAVLKETGLSQKYLNVLINVRRPFEDFAIQAIWKRGLADLGKEYEVKGNIKSAENLYKLTIEMAKQIQKEQINKPLGLDKAAQLRLSNLTVEISKNEEKEIVQNKSSTKKPFGVTLPLTGASVAGIVIVGLIMFLRKKKLNKTE